MFRIARHVSSFVKIYESRVRTILWIPLSIAYAPITSQHGSVRVTFIFIWARHLVAPTYVICTALRGSEMYSFLQSHTQHGTYIYIDMIKQYCNSNRASTNDKRQKTATAIMTLKATHIKRVRF